MGRIVDRTRQRYGRLLVLERSSKTSSRGVVWLCRCDCGTLRHVATGCLTTGNTKSCGCAQRESAHKLKYKHGRSATAEYKSWLSMLHRCYRIDDKKFYLYGGRGITVCERWQDFLNFAEDMGPRPAKCSLDRIDSNGNYEPGNCRWADIFTQNRNKRTNVRVVYAGKEMALSEAARAAGLKPATVHNRRFNGWPEWAWFYPEGTRRANLPEYGKASR
jgi:hypothetical protein